MTAEQVYELWTVNYGIARAAITKRAPSESSDLKRLSAKAGRLADEQTKRQIRDADAWQRFTNRRARASRQRRPVDKMPDLFKSPPSRSQRREEAASGRTYNIRKSDAA